MTIIEKWAREVKVLSQLFSVGMVSHRIIVDKGIKWIKWSLVLGKNIQFVYNYKLVFII